MLGNHPHSPTPYDDDWEDQPAQSPFHKYALGVVLPAAILGYGITSIVLRQSLLLGKFGVTSPVQGLNAVLYGVAWCAAAIFMHAHYFWGNIFDQHPVAVLGKIVSAIIFIASLTGLLIRHGVLGLR